MRVITSRQHPDIKKVVTLHTSQGRKKHNLFIAQGIRTCSTLIDTGMNMAHLYVQAEDSHKKDGYFSIPDSLKSFLETYDIKDSLISIVPDTVMEKISTAVESSGMVGVFHIPIELTAFNPPCGLVLCAITDPGNMGTLIRTSVAMNITTIIVIQGVDVWSPKVVQASAGAVGAANIYRMSWHELMSKKPFSLSITALVAHQGKSIKTVQGANTLLVVGSEAHGIDSQYLKDCTNHVTIEMPGDTESLNAAVAGSIALYVMTSHSNQ